MFFKCLRVNSLIVNSVSLVIGALLASVISLFYFQFYRFFRLYFFLDMFLVQMKFVINVQFENNNFVVHLDNEKANVS